MEALRSVIIPARCHWRYYTGPKTVHLLVQPKLRDIVHTCLQVYPNCGQALVITPNDALECIFVPLITLCIIMFPRNINEQHNVTEHIRYKVDTYIPSPAIHDHDHHDLPA